MEMGFTAEQSSQALHKNNGHFENAVAYLLDGNQSSVNSRPRGQFKKREFNDRNGEWVSYLSTRDE